MPGCTLVLDAPALSRDDALRAVSARAADLLAQPRSEAPDARPFWPSEPPPGAEFLMGLLLAREDRSPTAVPEGVAFPHAIDHRIHWTTLVIAKLPVAVGFATPTPVDLIFAIFGPSAEPWRHVRLLARLARICRAPGALSRLRSAADAEDLRRALLQEDESHD